MASHQDTYNSSGSSSDYYESGSESPVSRQLHLSGQSWPPAATTSNQSGYSHTSQSLDLVGSSLQDHDVVDMNYSFNHPGPNYSLPGTWSQDLGVGTNVTYTNDNIPSLPFDNLPFYPFSEFYYELPQHQHGYTSYSQVHESPTQPFVHDAHQHRAQDIYTSQTTQGSFPPVYPSASTQFLSQNSGGPVYRTDTKAPRSTPDNLALDGADTAGGAAQHSHTSPVATSSNQSSTSSPSHTQPSSPERKRLFPFSAAEEPSTSRRVVPRHDRAQSVHSASSDSPRRNSNPDVYGRGPLIPQERYTTSTISSYKAPDLHRPIAFDLERPYQVGIPIIDILHKTEVFSRIWDRTQGFDMGKKTFTLRVQWPGYRPWSKTIAAMDWTKARAPVTRVKLAEAVATAIRDLFERYRDEPYDTDYAVWNVGPSGIQLNQVCLVALHQVSRGSWQPELCLLGSHH